jgi:ATP-binding cassette subfamily B protein
MSRRRVGMLAATSAAMRKELFYSALLTEERAAKEVRLFGLGAFLKDRMLGELSGIQSAERRMDRKDAAVQSLLSVLSAAVAGGGLVWAVHAATVGRLTAGDVTAFVAAVAGVQAALVGLVTGLAQAHEALLMICRRCGAGWSCATCGSATTRTTRGCCGGWTCSSRSGGRSRWSASTARARAP